VAPVPVPELQAAAVTAHRLIRWFYGSITALLVVTAVIGLAEMQWLAAAFSLALAICNGYAWLVLRAADRGRPPGLR
jgi:uncharacterized membrane protein YhaH (DUF805 family)